MHELLQEYFFAIFAGIWVSISLIVSKIEGWARLAENYKEAGSGSGEKFWFQSAQLGNWTSYGNCLIFLVNPEGIRISVLFPFRIGHPPLFLPWAHMRVSEEKMFWQSMFKFNVSGIDVYVRKSTGQRIRAAAGIGWPGNT